MDKKQLSILIIVSVVLFVLGALLGIVFAHTGATQTKINAVSSLSSSLISDVRAYGQVASIEGRNLTLSNASDRLVIPIVNNAVVYSLSPASGKTASVQKTVGFENIKVGDKINVILKVLPTGQIQGTAVIIFP